MEGWTVVRDYSNRRSTSYNFAWTRRRWMLGYHPLSRPLGGERRGKKRTSLESGTTLSPSPRRAHLVMVSGVRTGHRPPHIGWELLNSLLWALFIASNLKPYAKKSGPAGLRYGFKALTLKLMATTPRTSD